MNNKAFVDAIKIAVRDAAVFGTLELLRNPPGRRPRQDLIDISKWFNSLSDEDKKMLSNILRLNTDAAVFGFLAVLDGERVVEDSQKKGEFELFYIGSEGRVRLNAPDQEMLHDIFNAERE